MLTLACLGRLRSDPLFLKPNRLLELLEQLQSELFSKFFHEVIIIVTSRWLLLEFCMDNNNLILEILVAETRS